ncbi:hypothetical protein [Brevibacterium oceani]|uniref:hypothetical protein n=1 Tax=Brevibacterium oceani TaxID=358099 RepID=UPI0015E69D88|nr:hypothetical protein [Brevibacterium oceani]
MISPRTLHIFELEADELPVGDWTAHRGLAQEAVEYGYAAELTQEYDNDAATETPLTHSLRFLPPEDVEAFDEGIDEQESPMGGSVTVEQFTLNRPHGFYGQRTPLEHSPVAAGGPGGVYLDHGGWQSVHSTLTQALETVLHEQNDLAWMPPKHHSVFNADGGLCADNDAPLLLNVDGSVAAEHVLDAFRAAAVADGRHISVATGREDLGSVFKANFTPDGQWSLGSYNATSRNEVEGRGPVPASQVTQEISDAFETHVERVDRESRGEERRAFGQSRPDDQALGALGQAMKNRPPGGVKSGLNARTQSGGSAADAAGGFSRGHDSGVQRETRSDW